MNSREAAARFYQYWKSFGISPLAARRKIPVPPLTRPQRLADESRLEQIAATLENAPGITRTTYAGHPARRTGRAETMQSHVDRLEYLAIRDAAGNVSSRTPYGINFSLI